MTVAKKKQKGNSPAGIHPIWLFGTFIAGMLVCVLILVVQRLGQPIPKVAVTNVLPQPSGPAPALAEIHPPNTSPVVVDHGTATQAGRRFSDAANPNRPVISAKLTPASNVPSNQSVMPPINSNVKTFKRPSPPVKPVIPAIDPFAKLPRDVKDNRLAVLALPDPTESIKPVVWDLDLKNADSFEITLLGTEALLSKKLAEIELIRKDGCEASGKRLWSLRSKNNLDSSEDPLGEFQLSGSKDSSQLTFVWLPEGVRRLEAELVRWLTIGLSAGPSKILCRLSESRPIPRLPCKFADKKAFSSAPAFDLRSPLLADRLGGSETGLLMDIALPTEFRIEKTFDSGKLKRMPVDTKSSFIIPLAVIPVGPGASDMEMYRKDGPLASVEFKPSIVGKSFALAMSVTASILIYDRDQAVKLRKTALESEEFTAPQAVVSGLSSSGSVGDNLNAAAATQVTTLIQDTIKKLEHESLRRDASINQAKRKLDAASSRDEEKFEKILDSLSKKQVALKSTIASLGLELTRHDARRLGMLRSLLLGDGIVGDADKSIRGIINNATIGITIGYECQFDGETYFMIIEEATE